jgi:hypothetical protein
MQGASTSYDVFLSYSRADSAAAESLRARLKEAGLTAFLDRYGLPVGQPWQPELEQQLSSCRALVALVGAQGFGEWQHREIELGLDRQASAKKAGERFPVIPVLLPGLANDAVPVGSFLSLNTWVDLRPGLDEPESLQRLVAGARGKAIDAAAAEKLLAGLTPYRGLLPFREQDAGLFFGRARFVEELVRKVGQRSAANVVAVIGRSGSGKSSIVYAGLFPALRRERGVGDQSVWQILHLRPHAEPLTELALAFNPLKADLGPMDRRAELNRLACRFRNREVSLAELVRDRLRDEPGSTRLLLYVDQWEELYTLAAPREPKNDEERARAADVRLFIDLVLEAAAKSSCTLALSARSDFYPDIQNHDGLRKAAQENQVSLGTMNEAELRAVIEGPAKALGASVDPKLTQKLIRDIGLDPASGQERRIRHRQAAAAGICARTSLVETDRAANRPRDLFRARTGAGGAGERALRKTLRRGAGGGQAPVREPRHARRGSRGHPRPHRHAERRRDAARDPDLCGRRGASHRHGRGRRPPLCRSHSRSAYPSLERIARMDRRQSRQLAYTSSSQGRPRRMA